MKAKKETSICSSNELSLRFLSDHSLNIARSRLQKEEEQLCVQDDMNHCYSRLKRLVPTIPQDKKVSKVEILQHVIDYILDLQLALETQPSLLKQQTGTCPPSPASNRTPLTVLNTDRQRTSTGQKEDSVLCR
ncbi:DNA-binding protein inhibitor ID-4-like [Salmo trutta]|uniref:DNA-binding protein inhibitor ID-4 n=1 Tax=Salmo trutta TaxID=8032 RepID=A0A674AEX2_SALTR|nr:DNA-binding protein inhibitor ID-4-like [Salmo trutta]